MPLLLAMFGSFPDAQDNEGVGPFNPIKGMVRRTLCPLSPLFLPSQDRHHDIAFFRISGRTA